MSSSPAVAPPNELFLEDHVAPQNKTTNKEETAPTTETTKTNKLWSTPIKRSIIERRTSSLEVISELSVSVFESMEEAFAVEDNDQEYSERRWTTDSGGGSSHKNGNTVQSLVPPRRIETEIEDDDDDKKEVTSRKSADAPISAPRRRLSPAEII